MEMKRHLRALAVILLLVLCTSPSFAATSWGELNFSLGYEYDQQLSCNSTQAGLKLAFEEYTNFDGKIHLSAKGWWDWKNNDGKLTFDQLWFSSYYGDVDYSLGRQTMSWGTADGFNPTNYFNRLSSTSLLSGDLSSDPLWSGHVTYYGVDWSLTGVVVPFFTPQKIDSFMSQLMTESGPEGAMVLAAIDTTKKPRGLGKNSELGLRAETQLAGFDVQASFFSGFEPLPGLEMILRYDPALNMVIPQGLEGKYRRQNFAGLAIAGTVGSMGVWAEASYGGPEAFGKSTDPLEIRLPLSMNKRYLQAVVGGDYTFPIGNGLLVQGQYIYRGQGSLFAPYMQPDLMTGQPGEIKGVHYLYGRFGYDFTPDSSVELVILHGVSEQNGIIRPAYIHRFPGSIQLDLSLVHAYGNSGISSIPTQGRLALKYSF